MARIKLLRNKKDIQVKQMRKEIAQLLTTGQEPNAQIRVGLAYLLQEIHCNYPFLSHLGPFVDVDMLNCLGFLKVVIVLGASPLFLKCTWFLTYIVSISGWAHNKGAEHFGSLWHTWTFLRACGCSASHNRISKVSVQSELVNIIFTKKFSSNSVQHNERWVPAVSYELAGWFWEFPNEIKILRKGFRKKNQVFGNGPIRRKKLPAFRQAVSKYPRQIIDWEAFFTAGSRPDIYFLGFVFKTMHSWSYSSHGSFKFPPLMDHATCKREFLAFKLQCTIEWGDKNFENL
jgi:hypothetical protein